MEIKARNLTSPNLGQVITLDNGETFGELSAVRFNTPNRGCVELTVGGTLVFDLDENDLVDITRNVVNSHQIRNERRTESAGGVLTDGDLDEIEKTVQDLISSVVGNNTAKAAL